MDKKKKKKITADPEDVEVRDCCWATLKSGCPGTSRPGGSECGRYATNYETSCRESFFGYMQAPRDVLGFRKDMTIGTVGIPELIAVAGPVGTSAPVWRVPIESAKAAKEGCDNSETCVGVILANDFAANGSRMSWMVQKQYVQHPEYRKSRPGKGQAWTDPVSKSDGTPGLSSAYLKGNAVPTCMTRICNPEDVSLVPQLNNPSYSWCHDIAKEVCNGQLDHPWCKVYCTSTYGRCDSLLEKYCDAKTIEEARADPKCHCFLPASFYETYFNDLAKIVGGIPASTVPACTYAPCSASKWLPQKYKANRTGGCPDIQQCIGGCKIDNQGHVSGGQECHVDVSCFNEKTGGGGDGRGPHPSSQDNTLYIVGAIAAILLIWWYLRGSKQSPSPSPSPSPPSPPSPLSLQSAPAIAPLTATIPAAAGGSGARAHWSTVKPMTPLRRSSRLRGPSLSSSSSSYSPP